MIGSPRSVMARKRARRSERGMRGMVLSPGASPREAAAEQAAEFGDDIGGKVRIVDVRGGADEPARGGLPHGRFQRLEQLRVGRRIRERSARRIECQTPPSGRKKRTGPSMRL